MQSTKPHHLQFSIACILSLLVFWAPLTALVRLSLSDYRYSHLILIPFISVCLVYLNRMRIFVDGQWSARVGAPLLLLGAALYPAGRSSWLGPGDALTLLALSIVAVWIAAFVWCYGSQALKAALFPLLFLVMFVPVPSAWVDSIIVMLQHGSAEITQRLFWAVGMPAFREGTMFSLPGITIEIAKECSSIRSGTALFITGLLSGYAFIRSPWRRALLVALTPPIAMFTNACRIVILCWLTVRVDPGYLYGSLHHEGGALFSLISVVALILAIALLSEEKLSWRKPSEDSVA
jgi:exosortase